MLKKYLKYQAISLGLFFFLACPFAAQAGPDKQSSVVNDHKLYFSFASGYSWSMSPNLNVNESPNATSGFVWDHPANGWDSKLGHTFNYGFAIGYNVSPLVSLELTYNNRPSFSYEKAQVVPTSTAIGSRNRCFDLQNKTLMLNGIVHLAAAFDPLKNFKNRFSVDPFINVGAGGAENTVSNFHSVGTGKTPGAIFSKMANKTIYNFAAQIGAGLDFDFTTNWSMRAGYRFVYAGKFKTQDYVLDDPDNLHPTLPGSGNAANPWDGSLKTNELYLSIAYTL